jgi:hypothetical protein
VNAVVFEHVPVAELLEKRRAKLAKSGDALVMVRIEEEPRAAADFTDDPSFGMWRDREDMADVAAIFTFVFAWNEFRELLQVQLHRNS